MTSADRRNQRDAAALFSSAERACKIVRSRSEAFINANEHTDSYGFTTTTLCPELLASTPSELVDLHLTAASLFDAASYLWSDSGCQDEAHDSRQTAAGIRGLYMDWS